MSDNSSSCASDSLDSTWMFYRDRADWADVTPLAQDDGPEPIVKIAYSDMFQDVFNYFRAIYASQEVSERALALTKDAVELNPANYTAWHHRRFLLKALKANIHEELDYIRQVIEGSAKNYQVWQHRRVLVEWLNDSSREQRFTEIVLSQDAKNYHAWQHRQWVMATFKLFDGEIEYVERLLEEDVRNNSAWNQRFFVVTHESQSEGGSIQGQLLDRELTFTMKAIRQALGNESAWNYLRGLIDNTDDSEVEKARNRCMTFCRELYDKCDKNHTAVYLMGAMVDLHSDQLETLAPKTAENASSMTDELAQAQKLCKILAQELDVIRKQYWSFLARDLEQRTRISV
eukprot:maker-scaffold187_size272365-snap-gene-0.13 protein:Tk10313 transcript:maker-scaffold187_size272365-snap-gene-0.13-mRNA-1 annotation:"protein farnesyltransferase geranylgeranyltransferase type-1 subunit alpha-like isoform x1"